MPTYFLTTVKRNHLIRTYILQKLHEDTIWRRGISEVTPEILIERGEEKGVKLSQFRTALRSGNITPIESMAEIFLNSQGIRNAKERLNQAGRNEFNLFCRELLEVEVPLQEIYLARHDGDYAKEAPLLSYWDITRADIESFRPTPSKEQEETLRPVGRPSANWDKLREQLNILQESMTELPRNWRTDISRKLRDWYQNESSEAPKVETIRDRLKPELDAIKQRLS